MDIDIERVLFGFVFITILFIAFNLAFSGLPVKRYIPEEDTDRLEALGKQYVTDTRPSFIGQIYFFFSSFLTILKTTFTFLTVGIVNIIFDVGSMFNVSTAILGLLSGVLVFILALVIIKKISGR